MNEYEQHLVERRDHDAWLAARLIERRQAKGALARLLAGEQPEPEAERQSDAAGRGRRTLRLARARPGRDQARRAVAGGDTTTKTRLRRRSNNRTETRAPRVANREKVLGAIRDEPGISVAALSAATGITKNVLYGLTRTLTERGEVERVDGADGAVGLRIAEAEVAAEPAQSAGDGALGAEESETPRRRRAGRKKPEETAAESASGPGGAP